MNLMCNILHVEDDDNDSEFFQRALNRLQFKGAYRRVPTVGAAMKYLRGMDEFAERWLFPLPEVLVMDSVLNGPPTSDDLMTWLKEQEEYRALVCVVLTGDVSPAKKEDWLGRGVVAVVEKGTSAEEFSGAVQEVLRSA